MPVPSWLRGLRPSWKRRQRRVRRRPQPHHFASGFVPAVEPLEARLLLTTFSIIGDSTVVEGSPYTLDLQAPEPVQTLTVNWGDGTVETFDNDPSSVTHIYSAGPSEFTITASATDANGTHSFQDTVLADNPLAYWRLGESSSANPADNLGSLGGAADGTYVGNVAHGAPGVAGDSDTAARFGDTNLDYVITNPIDFPTSAVSAEFWIKTDDTADTGVLSYNAPGADNEFLIFRPNNLQVYINGPAISTGVAVNDGRWNHIAVTWDSNPNPIDDDNLKVYKNGALEFSGTHQAGNPIDTGGSLVIGQEQDTVGGGFDPNQRFTGSLDEVAVFGSALSAEQVAAHYEASLALPVTVSAGGNTPPTLSNVEIVTGSPNSSDPMAGGLLGSYYDNNNFTNLQTTRVEAVDFDWGTGKPHSLIGPDTFSVRWEGFVRPRYTEEYTFFLRHDDGVRMWIGEAGTQSADQQILDRFDPTAPVEHASSPVGLEAGKLYPVRIDFFENGGGAVAELRWQSASQTKQIVPAGQLYTPIDQIDTSMPGLEGSFVHLTGEFTDPDVHDHLAVTVDWGDGTDQTYDLGSGATSFDAVRFYADDSGQGSFTITTTAIDDDGAISNPVPLSHAVANVAPSGTITRTTELQFDDGSAFTFPIDPKSTFLRTNEDPDATDALAIDLGALGLQSGDVILLDRLGDATCCGPNATETPSIMNGVFSAGDTLLAASEPHRVPGAIDTGTDFVSNPTFSEQLLTDIPEDFAITEGVVVTIPLDATHLFVGRPDSFNGDNFDNDQDFAVQITPQSGREGSPIFFNSSVFDPGTEDELTYTWTVTKDGQSFAPHPVHDSEGILTFDGVDDFVEIPDSPSLHSDRQLTVEGWFKIDDLQNTTWSNIFHKGNYPNCFEAGCSNREYALWVNSSGFLHFASTPADRVGVGAFTTSSPSGLIEEGRWYHVAAVINADTNFMGTYLNGELVASRSYNFAGIRETTGPLRFAFDGYQTKGSLNEMRVWNVARTPGEIEADMSRTLTGDEPGLMGYWRFDEGSGETVTDLSGNGNDGSFVSPGFQQGVAGALEGGTAYSFYKLQNAGRGADVAIDVPDINTSAGEFNTVSFWMNWNGINNAMPFGFTSYDLWINGGGFGFNTGQGNIYGIRSEGLENRWVHVTASFHNGDAKLSKLWIDGDEQTLSEQLNNTTTASRTATAEARLAGWPNGPNSRFSGLLDEVAIFNRQLTSQEIQGQVAAGTMADYRSAILGGQTPVAYYTLDESSESTVFDSSGHGHDGTIGTVPIWTASTVPPADGTAREFGTALTLDGDDDFVEVQDSPSLHSDRQLTVQGWFKVDAFNKPWQNIFWKGNLPDCTIGCENREFALWVHSDGHLQLNSTPVSLIGAGTLTLHPSANVGAGQWHHVAAVIDADANFMRLYLDGTLIGSRSYDGSGIRETSGPLRFGGNPSWNDQLGGSLDEFQFWNVARSEAEILADFDRTAPLTGTETGLAGYWRFDEGAGNLATDSTSNGNDGLLGASWDTQPVWETTTAAGNPNFSFTPDDDGTYVVTLEVTDDGGGSSGPVSQTVNVANVDPVLTISGNAEEVDRGAVYTLNLTSSDPGEDTISEWFIDWGDGSDPDGDGSVGEIIAGNPSAASHVYTTAGTFTISATATDEDGTFQASSGYSTEVLNDDPVAYWRLGESVGTTAENLGSIGSAVDGTYRNGVTLGQPGLLAGDVDTAASFDGVNDWVQIPNHADINTSGPRDVRTVELWFQAADVNRRQVLYEEGGSGRGLDIYIDKDVDDPSKGVLYVNGWNLNNDDSSTTTPWGPKFVSTEIQPDNVYHVALVLEHSDGFDGTITGYLNGECFDFNPDGSCVQATGVGRLFGHGADVRIGMAGGGARFHDGSASGGHLFEGTIDEVAIYNAALSAERLASHFTSAAGVQVTVVNALPTATDDTYTTDEDFAVSGNVITDDTGNGADSDPEGDPLAAVLVTGPSDGTLSLHADGSFTYTPDLDFNGSDSFTYRVEDGMGGTDEATVTLTVNAVNDPPVLQNDTATTDEDVFVDIDVLDNDAPGPSTAVDELLSQTLSVTHLNGVAVSAGDSVNTANGTVTLGADGTVRYTPNPDYNGQDSFSYTASDDGQPPQSASATGTVTINPENDPPVLTVPGPQSILKTETLTFEISATDVDFPFDSDHEHTFSFTSSTTDSVPTLVRQDNDLDEDGNIASTRALFSWTPSEDDEPGPFAFEFTVKDNGTPTEDPISVSKTVIVTTLAAAVVGNDLRIVGTSAADEVLVDASNPDAVQVTVNGTDSGPFALPSGGKIVADLHDGDDLLQVIGGTSSDVFHGGAGSDRLEMTADTDFTLSDTTLTGAGTDTLDSIEQVDLIGGAGDNTFDVSDWTGPGSIDGGGGTDSIVVSKDADVTLSDSSLSVTGGATMSLANVENAAFAGGAAANTFDLGDWTGAADVDGSAGTDTLIGPNLANTWQITAPGGGNVNGHIAFAGIENLEGGSLADSFNFADAQSIAGNVRGRGGIDTLSYTGYTTAVTVNVGAGTATSIGGIFTGLEQFVGSEAADAADTLIGTDEGNAWTIDGTNAGNIDSGAIVFSGFENLTAGAGNDTFTVLEFGSLSGLLDGGDGSDALHLTEDTNFTLSDSELHVSRDGGTTFNLASIDLAELTGGPSDNVFTISGWTGEATLDGAGGSDSFTVDFVGSGAGNVSIHDSTAGADDSLTVHGTAGADALTLSKGLVTRLAESVEFDPVFELSVNGNDGDDTLTVDFTGGNPVPAGGLAFHGGDQASTDPGDQLVLSNGSFATVTHTLANASDGSISLDGSQITYTGLEPIRDDLSADGRVFSFTGGAETITLSDDGIAANGYSKIESTRGESVVFANPSGSLIVTTTDGTGADTVNIEGLDSNFDADLTITTDADDTVNFQATATDLGTNNLAVSAAAVTLQAAVSAGAVDLDASLGAGDIAGAGALNVAGTTELNTTGEIALTGVNLFSGPVSIAAAEHVQINTAGAIDLGSSTIGGNLLITADGAITDSGPISVGGQATFDAGTHAITLGDDATGITNFGSLTFNSGGAVSISEDSATELTGTSTAGSLELDSTGAITDAAGTSLTVTGLADLSGSAITLGDNATDTTNFDSLMFNSGGGAVSISEDSATELTGTSTAGSLELDSAGAITDASGTSLTVTGLADLSGTTITLGNDATDTTNFGSLTFNSTGAVNISEDSATELTGTSTAGSLQLDSAGAITDAAGTSLTVTGLADLSGSAITLGDNATDTTNFDSLTFNSTGAVSISEDSSTRVSGASTAGGLTLVSAEDVTLDATVDVTGNTTITAGTTSGTIDVNAKLTGSGTILLDAANSITIDAAVDPTTVTLEADDDITISAAVAATDLITISAGQDGNGSVILNSSGSLTVDNGDDTADIMISTGGTTGEITLTGTTSAGDTVTVTAAGSINGAGLVTAGTIDLNAGSGIGNSTALELSGSSISADTSNGNIDLNNGVAATYTSVTTGTGTITVDNTGAATFGTASTLSGAIDLETTGGDLTVGSSVTAGGSADVTLTTTNSGNVVLTGTTMAEGDQVTINSVGSINGAGLVTAGTVDLNAVSGIGNSTALELAASTITADTTTGNIDVDNALNTAVSVNSLTTDSGSLTFDQAGGADVTFGTVTTGGAVALDNAAGAIALDGSVTAGSLLVTASGTITDGTDGDLSVTNNASFTGSSITLGNDAGNATNFGSLTFNSTGAVSISEDSHTTVSGGSTAGGLTLVSAGDVTLDATVDVTGNTTITAGGTIDVNAKLTGSGTILLDAAGSITIDAAVDPTTVTLEADDDITITAAVAATDLITISAGQDGSGSVILNGSGSLTVDNDGDTADITISTGLTTGEITLAGSTTADDTVTMTAAGSINGAGLVTGATVDLDAGSGIGNSTALELSGSSISAVTASGNIDLNNAVAATYTSVTTGTGTITVDNTGAATFGTVWTSSGAIDLETTDGDLTVGSSVTAGGTADVTLTTTNSGNVVLTGTTMAEGDQVTINSVGSINGAGLVTAGTVDLNAVSGIGNSTALELAASTITADTTTGNIDVDNALNTAVSVNSLTTDSGSITFDQSGGADVTFGTVSTGGAVALDNAAGAVALDGSVTAGSLIVTASGTITDGSDGDLSVTNNASFTGSSITLGNDAGNDTDFGSLMFNSTGTVSISEDSNTTVSGVSTAGGLTLVSAEDVTLNATVGVTGNTTITAGSIDVSAKLTSSGTILLDAAGSITIDAAVDPTTVTLAANDDITISAAVAATDLITISAGQDGNGSVILNSNGSLTVDNAGNTADITISTGGTTGEITLTGTTTADDTVTMTAAGSINGAGLVTGPTIDLNAGSGIGNTAAVALTGATITADSTDGDVDINSLATGDVTFTTLTTGTGAITLEQTTLEQTGNQKLTVSTAATTDGAISISNTGGDLEVTTATADGAGKDMALTTLTSGDILVDSITADGDQVTVNSAGSIIDGNAGANNITAADLALRATAGIGSSDPLDTAISQLAIVNTASGDVGISNDVGGTLTIGTVDSLSGVTNDGGDVTISNAGAILVQDTVTSTGTVTLTASSPLTVEQNVIAAGDIVLTASDSDGAGDDLTVIAGVVVKSTGGNVTLRGGDKVDLQPAIPNADPLLVVAASKIIAFGALSIQADNFLNNPDPEGATFTLGGILQAATIAVQGGPHDDTFLIDSSGTVNNVRGPMTVTGGAGSNSLTLNDSADSVPNTVTVSATQIGAANGDDFFGPGGRITNYTGLSELLVKTGSGDGNTIHLASSAEGTASTIDAAAGGSDETIANPASNTVGFPLGGVTFEGDGFRGEFTLDEVEELTAPVTDGTVEIVGASGDGGGTDDLKDEFSLIGTGRVLSIEARGNSNTVDFKNSLGGIRFDMGATNGQEQVFDAGGNRLKVRGKFQTVIGTRFDDEVFGPSPVNPGTRTFDVGANVFTGAGNDVVIASRAGGNYDLGTGNNLFLQVLDGQDLVTTLSSLDGDDLVAVFSALDGGDLVTAASALDGDQLVTALGALDGADLVTSIGSLDGEELVSVLSALDSVLNTSLSELASDTGELITALSALDGGELVQAISTLDDGDLVAVLSALDSTGELVTVLGALDDGSLLTALGALDSEVLVQSIGALDSDDMVSAVSALDGEQLVTALGALDGGDLVTASSALDGGDLVTAIGTLDGDDLLAVQSALDSMDVTLEQLASLDGEDLVTVLGSLDDSGELVTVLGALDQDDLITVLGALDGGDLIAAMSALDDDGMLVSILGALDNSGDLVAALSALDDAILVSQLSALDGEELVTALSALDGEDLLTVMSALDNQDLVTIMGALDGETLVQAIGALDSSSLVSVVSAMDGAELVTAFSALDGTSLVTAVGALDGEALVTAMGALDGGDLVRALGTLDGGELVTVLGALDGGDLVQALSTLDDGNIISVLSALDSGDLVTAIGSLDGNELVTAFSALDGGDLVTAIGSLDGADLVAVESALDTIIEAQFPDRFSDSDDLVTVLSSLDSTGDLVTVLSALDQDNLVTVLGALDGGDLVAAMSALDGSDLLTALSALDATDLVQTISALDDDTLVAVLGALDNNGDLVLALGALDDEGTLVSVLGALDNGDLITAFGALDGESLVTSLSALDGDALVSALSALDGGDLVVTVSALDQDNLVTVLGTLDGSGDLATAVQALDDGALKNELLAALDSGDLVQAIAALDGDDLIAVLSALDGGDLVQAISTLDGEDLVGVLSALDEGNLVTALSALDNDDLVVALSALDSENLVSVVSSLDGSDLVVALSALDSEDLVTALGTLDGDDLISVFGALDSEVLVRAVGTLDGGELVTVFGALDGGELVTAVSALDGEQLVTALGALDGADLVTSIGSLDGDELVSVLSALDAVLGTSLEAQASDTDDLIAALSALDGDDLVQALSTLDGGDLLAVLSALDSAGELVTVMGALDDESLLTVLGALDSEVLVQSIGALDSDDMVAAVSALDGEQLVTALGALDGADLVTASSALDGGDLVTAISTLDGEDLVAVQSALDSIGVTLEQLASLDGDDLVAALSALDSAGELVTVLGALDQDDLVTVLGALDGGDLIAAMSALDDEGVLVAILGALDNSGDLVAALGALDDAVLVSQLSALDGEELVTALSALDQEDLLTVMSALDSQDLVTMLGALDGTDLVQVTSTLDTDDLIVALGALDDQTLVTVLGALDGPDLVTSLSALDGDDLVLVLGALDGGELVQAVGTLDDDNLIAVFSAMDGTDLVTASSALDGVDLVTAIGTLDGVDLVAVESALDNIGVTLQDLESLDGDGLVTVLSALDSTGDLVTVLGALDGDNLLTVLSALDSSGNLVTAVSALDDEDLIAVLGALDNGDLVVALSALDSEALLTALSALDGSVLVTAVGALDQENLVTLLGAMDNLDLVQAVSTLDEAGLVTVVSALDSDALVAAVGALDEGPLKNQLQDADDLVAAVSALDDADLVAVLSALDGEALVQALSTLDAETLATVLKTADSQDLLTAMSSLSGPDLITAITALNGHNLVSALGALGGQQLRAALGTLGFERLISILLVGAFDTRVKGGPGNDVIVGRLGGTYYGRGGDDHLIITGKGPSLFGSLIDSSPAKGKLTTTTYKGGAGNDTYYFFGTDLGHVIIDETFAPGDLHDTLDFSSFTGGNVHIDLSSTRRQITTPGQLSVTLAHGLAIEHVIGSAGSDTIRGNAMDNVLRGADPIRGPVASPTQNDGTNVPQQVIFLDFESDTGIDHLGQPTTEHEYTSAEREAIQGRLEETFSAFETIDAGAIATPFFEFTQEKPASGSYITVLFNKSPCVELTPGEPCRPQSGGFSDAIGFGDTGARDGNVEVQINGILGRLFQPRDTSENWIALSTKIAAHEIAHQMGVLHEDVFSPIGFGIHTPPGPGRYGPDFPGLVGAFESHDHIISSPASVGSTRFNDLRDLYFGEREAIKLAFAVAIQTASADELRIREASNSLTDPQHLALAPLSVPNTIPEARGLNAGKVFSVQAIAAAGSIGIAEATGKSESDFYSFDGHEGDLINLQVLSNSVTRFANNSDGSPNADGTIDSIVRVFGPDGELIPYFDSVAVNDDQFEPTDSSVIDLRLPADGRYVIEIDTFAIAEDHPNREARCDTEGLDDFRAQLRGDACNDADTGNYELFIYRFDAGNPTDGDDLLEGRGGNDLLEGHDGDDTFVFIGTGLGSDVVDDTVGRTTLDFAELGGPATFDRGTANAQEIHSDHLTLTLQGESQAYLANVVGSSFSGDTLIGADVENVWHITDDNAGDIGSPDVFAFSDFENLTGSAQVDTFVFSDAKGISGAIDGAGGSDTLDYSAYTTPVGVTLADSSFGTATNTAGVQDIQNVIGGSAGDTLIGNSEANVLIGLAGNDVLEGRDGDDRLAGGSGNNTLDGEQGSDFYILLALNDHPMLADFQWHGSVDDDASPFENVLMDAGGQHDWIDFRPALQGVTLTLTQDAGQVQTLDAAGNKLALDGVFEHVIGSEYDDTLEGNAAENILIGQGGDDHLTGAAGRDLLIGGFGADRLVGSADDDILISGVFDFDPNNPVQQRTPSRFDLKTLTRTELDAIDAIFAEWTNEVRSFDMRVANLRNDNSNGLMSEDRLNRLDDADLFLQWGSTIFDDDAEDLAEFEDKLTGGAGSDLLFVGDGDVITGNSKEDEEDENSG